ncbi:MAG: glycosyltransferase family 39 protein [Halobacteriales archaeon]
MRRDKLGRAIRANPWLTGVLAAATVLFLFGIWRVAPYRTVADAIVSATLPFSILREPYGLTEFLKGGNFHIWLLAIVYLPLATVFGGYLLMTGGLDTVLDSAFAVARSGAGKQWAAANRQLLDVFHLFALTARFVSAVAGILTVLGVALLARRIAGRPAGVLAAATLSVTLGVVLTAKFATEDIVLCCIAVWTMVILARHYETGADRPLLLGAGMTGLATSTKLTGGVLGFVVAILAFRRYEPRELPTWGAVRDLARYPALAIAAYVATTPSLLAYPDTYTDVISRYATVKSGGTTFYVAQEPGWIAHLGHLVTALGVPLFALALVATVGVAALAATDRVSRFAWYPLGFAVVFYLFDSFTASTQYNRILLVVPFLAVFVGVVGSWAANAERPRGLRTAARGVLAVVLVVSLVYTAGGVAAWGMSRETATEWTHDNFDDSTHVTTLAKDIYLPKFPNETNVTQATIDPLYDQHTQARKERVLQRVRCHRTDYLVLSSFHYERYFEDPSLSPNRTAFYRSLLDGEAGYQAVAKFGPSDPNLERDAVANLKHALKLQPPSRNTNNPLIVIMKPTVPPSEGPACRRPADSPGPRSG